MKIDSEEEAIFIAERKEWGVRSVSKLNRPIQLSAVGAGFACPKTQSKPFSGERTSPLRTKRQHYSRFDTPRSIRFSMYYQLKSFRALYSLKSLIL